MTTVKYILDSNVYISAHMGYYHPDVVPSYWELLNDFGNKSIIESPKQVKDEISIKDNWLSDWAKTSNVFLKKDLNNIMDSFHEVLFAYEKIKAKTIKKWTRQFGKYKPSKDESMSDVDMFVIANVLFYKNNFPSIEFVLVTKEREVSAPYKSVRIPHVCNALNIRWIDDFDFIKETGIKFEVIAP